MEAEKRRAPHTDFSSTAPSHLTAVKGTAQNESSIASPSLPSAAYYNYSVNPFENYLLSTKASFLLNAATRLSIQPYFWYGYGTGGTQQTSLQEATSTTALHGGIADINGDGDTLDKVMIYRGSVTQTDRPGVSAQVNYSLDDQEIVFGAWAERAHHRQTQPGTTVDSDGHAGDIWLRTNLLKYADGTTYQGRNWVTVSTAASVFVQDSLSLLNNTLKVVPALSFRTIERNFTNIANSGSGGGADYNIDKTYSQPLPSLAVSLQATNRLQLFASATKSFRVPSNFEYGYLAQKVTYVDGVGTATGLAAVTVKPEVAINMDMGARYHGDMFTGSATVFLNKLRDRIASSYDPVEATTHDWNVGRSTTKGVELEAGTVPFHGYSVYASATYTRSTIEDNMIASATTSYATAGKQFPDTPKGMASLSLQYAEGPALINVSGKYQSSRFLTLVNDQSIAGYTTYDLNAAYKLPNLFCNLFKDPVIRLNVSNLLDKKGFEANSGSGSNIAITASSNPTVYALAPRFTSMSFQVDF